MVDFDRVNRENRQVYMVMDYETYSEAKLGDKGSKKGVGAYEYSKHPSTEILCVAWIIGTRKELKDALANGSPVEGVKSWIPSVREPQPQFSEFIAALLNPEIKLVAHNAFFEQVITRHIFAERLMYSKRELRSLPPSRWVCTAAMASACALPRSLDMVTKVLGLPFQKDSEGARLIQKLCKPRKPSKHNSSTRVTDPKLIERLALYCRRDIEAEVSLFTTLPMLSPKEQKVWELDQAINWRGVQIDRELVHRVQRLIDLEKENLESEAIELAAGELYSTRQRDAMLDWFHSQGALLPDIQKKTLQDALESGSLEGKARRMAEIRVMTGLTSLAKFPSLELRSRWDGRVRDHMVYHTASTGRWGSQGVQLQNLAKPLIDRNLIPHVLEDILED
jgi:DNA polymerase